MKEQYPPLFLSQINTPPVIETERAPRPDPLITDPVCCWLVLSFRSSQRVCTHTQRRGRICRNTLCHEKEAEGYP